MSIEQKSVTNSSRRYASGKRSLYIPGHQGSFTSIIWSASRWRWTGGQNRM